MIAKLIHKIYSLKLVTNLFLLWVFTIPFGSSIVYLSFDGFTLYPSIIFLLLLLPLFLITFKKFNRFQWSLFLLLFFLVIHSLCYLPFVKGKEDAIFDLRSIILFWSYFTVLLSSFIYFGKEKWKSLLSNGLRF